MHPEKSSRMDTSELKAQLFKKVGPERFKRYFFCLNRFINQKLSKSDFDKSCYRILGRENLPLHNQIIRAIVKNAFSAKAPPPSVHEAGHAKPAVGAGMSLPVLEDGHGQLTAMPPNQSSVGPYMSNGIVPMSPRKVRSGVRERKLRDRPSTLGPSGKLDSLENGDMMDMTPCDYQRPLQPENEDRLKKTLDVPKVVQGNIAVVEDGEEVEQARRLKASRSPLLAPLGIPYCSASIGGARKSIPAMPTDYISCFDIVGLSDSDILRRRMVQIAVSQGLGGVTMECANTLNNMLDVYLKRLIRSCLELVGSRSSSDISTTYAVQKQQNLGKLINGHWPSNHLHMQSGGPLPVEEHRVHHSVSLLDFKVAMELNPKQLGEDWPVLLEKISMQAFED